MTDYELEKKRMSKKTEERIDPREFRSKTKPGIQSKDRTEIEILVKIFCDHFDSYIGSPLFPWRGR
ncbi:MAG: hypothetical protein ACE5R6_08130 [Candidatus Heimdallarchaeota archaeon]